MNMPAVPANLKVGKFVDVSKVTSFGAPVAAIGVSVLILLFVVWPKVTEVFKLRASNVQLESRASAMSAKAQLLSALNKSTLDTQVSAAELLLPSDKATFRFVRFVELAAARSGVILNKIDAAPGLLSSEGTPKDANSSAAVAQTEAAPFIQVKISLTSDYRSLLNFLVQVYSSPRVTGVKDLAISAGSAAGSGSSLKTSMVIDAYWKPLPKQLGSIESPVENLSEKEKTLLSNAALSEASPGAATGSAVPAVPTGKSDLFAPFE